MRDEDLLSGIQRRARLAGPNESRRIARGVLTALGDVLPARALDQIARQLPGEVRSALGGRVRSVAPATCRGFLGRVSELLLVDQPDNAFLARVVIEQLNANPRVLAPAAYAHLVAADLRPLLRAGQPATAGRVVSRVGPVRPDSTLVSPRLAIA